MVRKRKAFTLAEVVITLGIIGVVAAMTIPALSARVQKIQCESAFKVTYARLTQMLQTIEADYGSIANIASTEDELLMLFKSYSAGASICSKSEICWPEYWFTEKGLRISSREPFNTLMLANGAVISMALFSKTCTNSTELREPIGCVRLRVDTNGKKSPNRLGYDVFDFYVTSEGLIPRGDARTRVPGDQTDGWGRASYLLHNGRIDY